MRFLIFRQQQRPGVPVRREELTKIVLREYKGQRVTKLSSRILALAAARFPRAFGMELKEVTLKTHTKHGQSAGLGQSRSTRALVNAADFGDCASQQEKRMILSPA